jgi:hypothetical protein
MLIMTIFAKIRDEIGAEKATQEFLERIESVRRETSEFKGAEKEEGKINDLLYQKAQSCKQFWNTLGLIQVMFYRTQNLDRLIKIIEDSEKNLDKFEDEIFNDASSLLEGAVKYSRDLPEKSDIHNVYFKEWIPLVENYRTQKTDVKKTLIEKYEDDIENLGKYLKIEIDKFGFAPGYNDPIYELADP